VKKTEYFLSSLRISSQAQAALDDLIAKRNQFLENQANKIGAIDLEDVSIIAVGSGHIYVLLKLTYFPKSI